MVRTSVAYVCQSCGFSSAKWLGKCPSCDQWDTFSEEMAAPTAGAGAGRGWNVAVEHNHPVALPDVSMDCSHRTSTGIGELDRTLGGGIVAGSFSLVGGDPGIGKSTLLLQVAGHMAKSATVLYVSGEESPGQIKMRAQRLDCLSKNLLTLPETRVEEIERHVIQLQPALVVIDSIQTLYTSQIPSAPGTVGQVRESAGRLLGLCKSTGIPMFLIGHVTKQGAIAGPRLLEHMVDTVLYLEGEKTSSFRILRGVKNRFGATNEIGVFEMKAEGLREVDNPSELFLSDRPGTAPGSVVVACLNGQRPLLVEIQALVASSNYAMPRRTTSGVDQNRLAILTAIIEKRGGYHLAGEDIFVNVAGGSRLDEPAVDLGIITAIVSSFRDAPIDPHTVIMGEVGLTGEIRSVSQLETRLYEAVRLGFTRAVVPTMKQKIPAPKGMELTAVANVHEAMDMLIGD